MNSGLKIGFVLLEQVVDNLIDDCQSLEDILTVQAKLQRHLVNTTCSAIATMAIAERDGAAKPGAAYVYYDATEASISQQIKSRVGMAATQFKFNNPFDSPLNAELREELMKEVKRGE